MILVTGGCGFIGSNFVLQWIEREREPVLNLDKLTYAGNPGNLGGVATEWRYVFVHGDIADRRLLRELFNTHRPRSVVHFAAESHVDRSILGPEDFIRTNVNGTFAMLEEARSYWAEMDAETRSNFRFLHVSTDEVYGSLGPNDPAFTETTRFAPNSPYSASKAASDCLVRAYHHTYGLPTLTVNCSNNYGPRQFPEKLIPLVVLNALAGKPIPVYGDGMNVRDWLYVEDHCEAISAVLTRGRPGETYNVGGRAEKTNIGVVREICSILDSLRRRSAGGSYDSLISFVQDRPGHDRRYAIDTTKIERELDWRPRYTFEQGLRKTIQWYLANQGWVENVVSGTYQQWIAENYGVRGRA